MTEKQTVILIPTPLILAGIVLAIWSGTSGNTLFLPFGVVAAVAGFVILAFALQAGPGPEPVIVIETASPETIRLFTYGMWFAALFPIIGFIMGVVLLNKDSSRGVRVICLSIGATILWAGAASYFAVR